MPELTTPTPSPSPAPTPEPTPEPTPAPTPEPAPVKADWPDDWRTKLSAGDEKALKQLERYASPADIWKKARALEQRMSSGELKAQAAFPDKGTPEEQAAWRKDYGIPDKPEGYDLTLPDGLMVGENDKPIINEFLKLAHGAHMRPEHVKSTLSWYYQERERQMEAQSESDNTFRKTSEDELRGEWGNEYRANVNLVQGLLDTAPTGLKDLLNGARLSDGTALANHPNVLRFLVDLARQINPVTTVVPGAGANVAGAIEDEIAGLEKQMGNRSSEYWKGPKSEQMQARYRQLVEARDKVKKAA